MGLFTKDIKTMDDLFLHTLQDIYYAENKIVKSLPEMIENATDAQLKSGLQAHLGETKGHVQRLEQVFQMLGKTAKSVDCPAIDGIIDEAEDVTGEVDDKNVLDAAIIAAGQAVEHYEITRYGSLIAWAKQLGRSDVAKRPRADLERGEGGRQETHHHRREQGQPESSLGGPRDDQFTKRPVLPSHRPISFCTPRPERPSQLRGRAALWSQLPKMKAGT